MSQIRKRNEVFDNNADVWVMETHNDKVLGLGRYYNKKKLLALFNFGDGEETAWIHYGLLSHRVRLHTLLH